MEKVKEVSNHIIGKNYEAEHGEIVQCAENTNTKDECMTKCYYSKIGCSTIGCNWSARSDNKAVYFIKQ